MSGRDQLVIIGLAIFCALLLSALITIWLSAEMADSLWPVLPVPKPNE